MASLWIHDGRHGPMPQRVSSDSSSSDGATVENDEDDGDDDDDRRVFMMLILLKINSVTSLRPTGSDAPFLMGRDGRRPS